MPRQYNFHTWLFIGGSQTYRGMSWYCMQKSEQLLFTPTMIMACRMTMTYGVMENYNCVGIYRNNTIDSSRLSTQCLPEGRIELIESNGLNALYRKTLKARSCNRKPFPSIQSCSLHIEYNDWYHMISLRRPFSSFLSSILPIMNDERWTSRFFLQLV